MISCLCDIIQDYQTITMKIFFNYNSAILIECFA